MKPTAKPYGSPSSYEQGLSGNSGDSSFSEDEIPHPKRHNLEPFTDSSKTRVLRFWLNVVFMVGAIAGLVVYFYYDTELAKYILITSCVFKFIELVLRILKI